MKDNVIGKSIEQSQSLKDNPKFINITTEGFIFDGYLDDELRKARKIIYGEDDGISAERFLPWLYTQDSESEVWQDRSSWVKSNPTLGVIKKWDYLEEQLDVAKTSKADRIFVLSKDFNIKQNSSESWLNFEDYSYKKAYNLEDFRGAFCLGAVDLSETTDLTCAKILMMKSNDNTKYIHTMYFIPETKLDVDNDDHSAGAKYKEWAERGYITISEGSDIDLSIVADWFYKIYKDYDIKLVYCGYDQRFSKDWLKRMDDLFSYTKGNELILINQNSQTLSNAMKMCESEFKHQRINYNLNPVDMWCLSNGAIQVDNQCRCLCVKKEANKRIDGAVTFIILYETYRRYRSEFAQYIKKQKLKGGDLK
ncbi:MAG: terminase large subunit [Ruminococcus sp.]|nr:terminase large subunit [Ruminococcus sp.]